MAKKEFDPYTMLMQTTQKYPRPKRYEADVPTREGHKLKRASTLKILRSQIYESIKNDTRMYLRPVMIVVEYYQTIAPNKVEHDYVGRIVVTAYDKDIYWEGKKDYGKVKADGSIIKNKWMKE